MFTRTLCKCKVTPPRASTLADDSTADELPTMTAAGLLDALSLCARTGIRASLPLQEMCTSGVVFISRVFASSGSDASNRIHQERIGEIVRETVIDDYFKRKKCKMSLKTIKTLLLSCPGIARPILQSVIEYCVSSGNEVKCGDARHLTLALVESKDPSYVSAVQSRQTKKGLSAVITNILKSDFKKRDRAVAAMQWSAKVLKLVIGNSTTTGGGDDKIFLDAMPAIVPFLDDPSSKMSRAAEQCAFWILNLHSQGENACPNRPS